MIMDYICVMSNKRSVQNSLFYQNCDCVQLRPWADYRPSPGEGEFSGLWFSYTLWYVALSKNDCKIMLGL